MKTQFTSWGKRTFVTCLLLPCILQAFADGSTTFRPRGCTWLGRKYVAETKGKKCGAVRREIAKHEACATSTAQSWVEFPFCASGVFRRGEGFPYTPSSNPSGFTAIVGLATARIGPSGSNIYTWGGYGDYRFSSSSNGCSNIGYMCMGGDNAIYPVTAPTLSPVEKNNSYRSIKIETSKQSFDERLHTVTIDNFTATLINNPYDKVNEFSALQIAVLQSSGSRQDSINRNSDNAYRAHVMVESRVMLNNGRLSIDGVLQDAKIETKDSAGVQITHITMPRISIKIDEQMSPDDIAVVIGSDVGNLESGISTRYLPGKASLVYDVSSASTSNEVLEFSGYPNPVTQGAATIDAQVAQTQQVTIGLYDQDNTLILPIYSGALQGHSRRSFPVNLQQLAPGIYYLRLTRSASSLSRRVVIR